MRSIGLGAAGPGAAIRVISPYQLRIALPGGDVCQFIVTVPPPAGPLKDRDPAFRADAGSGEHEDASFIHSVNAFVLNSVRQAPIVVHKKPAVRGGLIKV